MDVTLLVVDDELPTLDTLAELLRWDGYAVLTAADGRQALDVLAGNHVDLVLLDVMMPRRDGIEALRAIRSRPEWAAILVVLMTAAPDSVPRDAPRHEALLIKPFHVDALRNLVARLCRPDE